MESFVRRVKGAINNSFLFDREDRSNESEIVSKDTGKNAEELKQITVIEDGETATSHSSKLKNNSSSSKEDRYEGETIADHDNRSLADNNSVNENLKSNTKQLLKGLSTIDMFLEYNELVKRQNEKFQEVQSLYNLETTLSHCIRILQLAEKVDKGVEKFINNRSWRRILNVIGEDHVMLDKSSLTNQRNNTSVENDSKINKDIKILQNSRKSFFVNQKKYQRLIIDRDLLQNEYNILTKSYQELDAKYQKLKSGYSESSFTLENSNEELSRPSTGQSIRSRSQNSSKGLKIGKKLLRTRNFDQSYIVDT
jgi:hypothetical protein